MSMQSFHLADEEYLNYLKAEMERPRDDTISKEDALKEVDEVLSDLSIEDVEVTDCVKAIGTLDSESWAELDEKELPLTAGYSVYLSTKAGDVTGYTLPFERPYNDLPETLYAPSFLAERIHIIVTKEGIQRFEWTNIAEKEETIAENTKLLPFEDIKDKLAEHLLYLEDSRSGGKKEEGVAYFYKVKDVELRAANINAYEDPSSVWLVPAWVFTMEYSAYYETEDQTRERNLTTSTYVFNAIDEGYITVKMDL